MIKSNQQKLNRLHVALDAMVIAVSYVIAWAMLLLGNRLFSPGTQVLPPRYYFVLLAAILPLYLILYAFFHLYTPKRVQQRRYEFANICKANLIGLLILTMGLFLLRDNPYYAEFSRRILFYFAAVNIAAQTLERGLIRDAIIADIGPIIGAHVGAGMFALVFMSDQDLA